MSDHSQDGPQDPNTPNDPNAPQTQQVVSGGAKPFYLRPPVMAGAAIAVVAIIAAVAFTGPSGESGPVTTQEAKAQTANQAGAETAWDIGRPGDIVMGSPEAPVKMVEYASMTCPHCAAFKLAVFPDIKKKYIDTGLVQYTLREFPTPPVSLSLAGFMLARCTGEDRYYKAVEALFRTQRAWVKPNPQEARAQLEKISRQFGLDEAAFESCISNEQELERIRTVVNAGQQIFGINSTPSFVINGRKANIHSPTFEALDSLIKESLPEGTEVPDYTPVGYQDPAADASDSGSDEGTAETTEEGAEEATAEDGEKAEGTEEPAEETAEEATEEKASGEKAKEGGEEVNAASGEATEAAENTSEDAGGEEAADGAGDEKAAGEEPSDQ